MYIVIRISGMVDVDHNLEETLFRLRLRRKYAAILLEETKENNLILNKIRNFVAYGKIDNETLALLLEKRAKPVNPSKKLDIDNILKSFPKKDLLSLGVKPFFRLHPPIGGIDSKIHFPRKKGVLGDNKEKINDLVRRML